MLDGGFVGVDVFFVLSGYLVTQVLLRDLDGAASDGATPGRVRLGRFYARRVRRLLPAAVVTIVVTAAVYGAVADRADLAAAADAARASLLYVANWHYIGEATDYFAPDDPSPYLHFWSLAVEEQFYIAWPLLLAGLWALAGKRAATPAGRRTVVAVVVLGGAAASFAAALLLRHGSPTRAYFGTDTRAYQLLAGAAVALLPQVVTWLRERRWATLAAPLGLVAIGVAAAGALDPGPFARSAVATAATVLLILGVEAHDRSPVAKALSVGAVTYLGTISYATYLWHWPVIVIAGELDISTSATTLAALTAVLATALAALSSELLELPIRRSELLDRHRLPVIAGGVATSIVAAVFVVPALLDLDRPRADIATTAAPRAEAQLQLATRTPVPASFDYRSWRSAGFGQEHDCVLGDVDECTLVEGDGPHILLLGDSNASMYVPAFAELARRTGTSLSVAAIDGCPWQLGFTHLSDEIQARCARTRPDTYDRVIPGLRPDVIVLVNSQLNGIGGAEPTTDRDRTLEAATVESLARLEASGAEIVVVDPVPQRSNFDSLECLASATYVEECAFVPTVFDSWHDRQQQDLAAASEHVHYVNWDTLICPRLPVCDVVHGDQPVFWNQNHLTAGYSESLALPIARQLAGLGLLPPPPPG